jgi:AcrR family transcriptional regulator
MQKPSVEKATPQRRERKKQQSASHMSAVAYALFEAHGFDAVSMEQIAERADVAKATLYSYFPIKEALLAHRFREDIATGMAERAAALQKFRSFKTRMRYLLRESAEWHAERLIYLPHYLRYLTGYTHQNSASTHQHYATDTVMILTSLIRAGQQSNEVSTTLSAERIAWNLHYLLFAAMTQWLADPSQSLPELFLSAFEVLMFGVANQKHSIVE